MFVKCPKCELNYMESTDRMCKVCYREIYGTDMPEEVDLCNICNETPVMPGKDVCSYCFKELLAADPVADDDAPDDADEDLEVDAADLDVDEDALPDAELQDIDSLEALEEQEEDEADAADAEDDDDL